MGDEHPVCAPWLRTPKLASLNLFNSIFLLEATGGFEPPNRGFADLRLNHLATSPRFALRLNAVTWCRGWDLNPHELTPTAPSRPRVYQFHHLGPAVRCYYSMYRLNGHPVKPGFPAPAAPLL